MVTDKKPTKPVSKVAKKSTSKKSQQKILKLVKPAKETRNTPSLSIHSHSKSQPPDGFRVVSITQALMEYSGPLVETVNDRTNMKEVNEIFGVAAAIWDYTSGDKSRHVNKKSKTEILALIEHRLGFYFGQANKFFSMMVERKNFLFPSEIQPLDETIMFIRNDVRCLVTRFNREDLNLSPQTIHPTADDLKVIHNISRLDQYVIRSADYDEYEELLLEVQQECLERFDIWLTKKEVIEYHNKFVFFTDTYLAFIYAYGHEESVTLKSGPGKYFVEFMVDHLLRKTSFEPWEYTLVPAAMMLFYIYLYEMGYLIDPPNRMVDFIDELEPEFIKILREQFS